MKYAKALPGETVETDRKKRKKLQDYFRSSGLLGFLAHGTGESRWMWGYCEIVV